MANEEYIPCGFLWLDFIVTYLSYVAIQIIKLIIFVCLASFIIWIIFLTNAVKFQVHDADLTRFDLNNQNNNLYYNLSLNFSIRNSNRHIGVHYDRFEAAVYYSDQRLASVSVPSFYQGHKTTTVLGSKFEGQNLVLLGDIGRRKFEDDRKIGVYGIEVKMRIRSRVLFAHLVTWPMKPIIHCHLQVPLGSSNSSRGFDFQSTKCHVGF